MCLGMTDVSFLIEHTFKKYIIIFPQKIYKNQNIGMTKLAISWLKMLRARLKQSFLESAKWVPKKVKNMIPKHRTIKVPNSMTYDIILLYMDPTWCRICNQYVLALKAVEMCGKKVYRFNTCYKNVWAFIMSQGLQYLMGFYSTETYLTAGGLWLNLWSNRLSPVIVQKQLVHKLISLMLLTEEFFNYRLFFARIKLCKWGL